MIDLLEGIAIAFMGLGLGILNMHFVFKLFNKDDK